MTTPRRKKNWWIQLVYDTWRSDWDDYQKRLEEASVGYATEASEFKERNPAPTIKRTMIGLKHNRMGD